MPNTQEAASSDHVEHPQQFHRSMGLVANFSLGFTYLSPLVGVFSLFAFAMVTAGPPSIWWIFVAAGGQLLVALVFGDVVSQYPITGGLYPWARRLWGKRYAWMVAWIYLAALIVTITAVAEYSTVFIASLFGFEATPGATLFAAVAMLVLALVFNMSGTHVLSRVTRIGFFAEIIGVIALGLYLMAFHRVNSFNVVFDSFGAGADNYGKAFLMAALVGLFLFYGFEACGDVAEEVEHPGRRIPLAMVLTIVFGGISAVISFMGYILAAPNLEAIVNGDDADPISAILTDSLGSNGAKAFLVVALIAFISCVLSLQAALSRLLFSFGRDSMLPGSKWLATLSVRHAVPTNAIIVACIAPMIICLWVFFQPDNLYRATAFAVSGIYIAFQMVVLASLRQRLKGWKPAGEWSLGRWGMLVNIAALAYGVLALILLIWPAEGVESFLDRWIVAVGLVIVIGVGLLYMAVARPYRGSNAPEGDAIEVAERIRSGGSH